MMARERSSACSDVAPQINSESPRFTDPFPSLDECRSSEDPRDRNATSRQSKNEASIHYRLRAKINDVKNCVSRTREAFKAVQENILMLEVPPESLYQEWLGIEKVLIRRIFFGLRVKLMFYSFRRLRIL